MYFLITKIEEIDMFLFKWKMVKNAISSLKEKKRVCLSPHDRSENFYDARY
jgi:hypothetical protein